MAQTMRQMVGADPSPHSLANSAVLMIDAQLEYVSGRMVCDGVEAALEQGGKLIAKARDANRPVIHIQHKGAPGGLFDPETDNYLIAPQVAPEGTEPVINKALPNAFSGTDLETVYRRLGCESLIIAGFMTHMCVSTTARGARPRHSVHDRCGCLRDPRSTGRGWRRHSGSRTAPRGACRVVRPILSDRRDR